MRGAAIAFAAIVLAIFFFLPCLLVACAARRPRGETIREDEHRLAEVRGVLLHMGIRDRRGDRTKNHVSFPAPYGPRPSLSHD